MRSISRHLLTLFLIFCWLNHLSNALEIDKSITHTFTDNKKYINNGYDYGDEHSGDIQLNGGTLKFNFSGRFDHNISLKNSSTIDLNGQEITLLQPLTAISEQLLEVTQGGSIFLNNTISDKILVSLGSDTNLRILAENTIHLYDVTSGTLTNGTVIIHLRNSSVSLSNTFALNDVILFKIYNPSISECSITIAEFSSTTITSPLEVGEHCNVRTIFKNSYSSLVKINQEAKIILSGDSSIYLFHNLGSLDLNGFPLILTGDNTLYDLGVIVNTGNSAPIIIGDGNNPALINISKNITQPICIQNGSSLCVTQSITLPKIQTFI